MIFRVVIYSLSTLDSMIIFIKTLFPQNLKLKLIHSKTLYYVQQFILSNDNLVKVLGHVNII